MGCSQGIEVGQDCRAWAREPFDDERLLAGSDDPHPEGLADPDELAGLAEASRHRILPDNAAELLSLSA